MKYSASEIAERVGGEVVGDGDIELAGRRSFLWTDRKPADDTEKPAAD